MPFLFRLSCHYKKPFFSRITTEPLRRSLSLYCRSSGRVADHEETGLSTVERCSTLYLGTQTTFILACNTCSYALHLSTVRVTITQISYNEQCKYPSTKLS